MRNICVLFCLVILSGTARAPAAVPVLTDALLSENVWSFSECKSWGLMKFENTEFRSDIPMSGDHCVGSYTVEGNVLHMSIRSQNIGFLPGGEKQGSAELVLKEMPSPFHPYALVDKASGKPKLWPSNVHTSYGKTGCRYEGIDMTAVHRRGFVKGDSVYLRSAPSPSAAPLFSKLQQMWESDNPRSFEAKRFLMKGQLLAVIGRTKDKAAAGSLSDYWYLVIPFMYPKSEDAGLVFGMSADEKGPFYLYKPVWMFGKYVDVTKEEDADLLNESAGGF